MIGKEEDTRSGVRSSRILIVEDEAIIAMRIEHALTQMGYQVVGMTSTGEEALQIVTEQPPDLVLMDIKLAEELDGVETASQIRERFDVPIVYLSAHPERMMQEDVKRTHPSGFLSKPVRDQELRAAVDMALYKHRLEAKLRESEQRYRLLAENVEDVIWQTNETIDRYTYVSPSVTRLLGYTPDEMMEMDFLAHLTPAFRPRVKEAVDRRLTAEAEGCGDDETRLWEMVYTRRDGTTVWVESTTRPLRDEDGTFLGLVGVTRDVSERKRAEEALRKSERRRRQAQQLACMGHWDWDVNTNTLHWSPEVFDIFGQDPRQFRPTAAGFEALIHPEDRDTFLAERARMLEAHDYADIEHRIILPDGRIRHVQELAEVLRDERGEVVQVSGTVQDITERKQATQALRESEERFRLIAETSSDMIFHLNLEGRVTYCSPSVERVLGLTPDEVMGTHLRRYFPATGLPQAMQNFQRAAAAEQVEMIDAEIVNHAGKLISVEATLAPIIRNGRVVGVQGAARDVSERKRIEKAVAEERDRLDTILSTLNTGLSLINPDMTIAWVNRKIRQMFPEGDPVGQVCHVFYESLDRPCENCGTRKAFETGEIQMGERFNRVNERWYAIISQPVKDDQGGVIQVLEGVTDITERKRAEKMLESERTFLLGVLDNIAEAIIICNKEGQITHFNEAARRLHGLPEQPISPNQWAKHYNLYRVDGSTHLPTEEIPLFRALQGEHVHNAEIVVAPKNRRTHTLVCNGQALTDEAGHKIGAVIAMHDITKRKRAEETLRQYAERLRILHEIDAAILAAQSPEAIARVALERLHDVIPYQHASVSQFDLTRQRVREVVIVDGGEPAGRTSAWQSLTKGSSIIENVQGGQVHLVQDLSALEMLSSLERDLHTIGGRGYVSVPMVVRGELVGTLNLTTDTPDFFQPEHVEILGEIAASLAVAMQQAGLLAQTQRDAETKALLLREVNHRVMNNLTMIMSILELEMAREADVRASLQDIYGRIHGIATVHRLLSTRQDALDLGEIVSQIVHLALSSSPIQYRVQVTVEAPDDLPRVSERQATALALIVNELVTNSVKYAFADRSRGQIRVQIETLEVKDGKPKVRMVFRDDGPGWPDDVLTGERQSMGIRLIQSSVTHTLEGEIDWRNDDGAVTEITF